MKYEIDPAIFELAPDMCFGIIAATDIGPARDAAVIEEKLAHAIAASEKRWADTKVKESDTLKPYRELFRSMDVNPNKFPCSIESLLTRISKGKGLPRIHPLVDAGNAVSIQFDIPLGAHDAARLHERTLSVRPAKENDRFIPFGGTEEDAESPEEGEFVYASGDYIHTRRLLWRQSERGKITDKTTEAFFPLDGFLDRKDDIIAARDTLAELLREQFGATVEVGFLDKDNPTFETETFK